VQDKPDAHTEDDADSNKEERGVRISPAEMKSFGIETAVAEPGKLDSYVELPGEIVFNADRVAHVVPQSSGVVREVLANVGDNVKAGAVLAVIESRELSDIRAAFLSGRERLSLAETNFSREERLWKQKITSEQEYLSARQALAEARIELRSSEQKLHALGYNDESLKKMPDHPNQPSARLEIKAPFAGTVVEKHITLGESLKDDSAAYTIADLSTVWADIQVYQKDLPKIRKGQKAVVTVGSGIPDVTSDIYWVGPVVGEETRTALTRVVLPNQNGTLRPGFFITARIATDSTPVNLLVPKSALLTIDNQSVLFIQTNEEFLPQKVKTGRENASHIEITEGLLPGQTYVSAGAFTLKAQISKGAFGDGHNH